jgi:hypothetical protein
MGFKNLYKREKFRECVFANNLPKFKAMSNTFVGERPHNGFYF